MLKAKVQYLIKFSKSSRKFCLRLFYSERNSFLCVNATKTYQFEAKDSDIKKYSLCLGNISRDFSANNMKKTSLNESVNNFSVEK